MTLNREQTPENTVWALGGARLPLVTGAGRAFSGLENTSCPELADELKKLFHHLDGVLGFQDTAFGRESQAFFNTLLGAAYPELLLDLADRLYVQHERPAVFLNFDHINVNLRKAGWREPFVELNAEMGRLFTGFCQALKTFRLDQQPEVVGALARGYSHYMHQTKNFPWDEPPPELPEGFDQPVLDVAPGLTGFNLIDGWPEGHPTLVLADQMPFIVETLEHFKARSGKRNIDIARVDFSGAPRLDTAFGFIQANKFMHHLKRPERQRFLAWTVDHLLPGGHFHILDTNLEQMILLESAEPAYQGRLIPGYLETLVEVERDFCQNLARDTQAAGFQVTHFDFHEYRDETDAYSEHPGDAISLTFVGLEIAARKPELTAGSRASA